MNSFPGRRVVANGYGLGSGVCYNDLRLIVVIFDNKHCAFEAGSHCLVHSGLDLDHPSISVFHVGITCVHHPWLNCNS